MYNDYHKGLKVLSALEREFEHCESFCISVAFITMGGITSLLGILQELEERNIPGRILTTNYLNFSDPKALKKLQAFANIELRMYWAEEGAGFHTKGYIFRRGDVYRMIVGSSNLTAAALTQNEEWNTKLISLHDGEYTQSMLMRFGRTRHIPFRLRVFMMRIKRLISAAIFRQKRRSTIRCQTKP